MRSRKWLWSSLGAAALLAVGAAGPAQAQDLAKCQKQIENIGRAFQDQVFKALQFCKDTYRTELVKAQTLSLPEATFRLNLDKKAPVCGNKLDGVLGAKGGGLGTLTPKSQAEKTYKKLNDLLLKGKCTSDHITQLGHLPPGSYGDAWIRWFLTAMLKSAYEKQLWLVGDLPNIMAQFVDPDPGNPGDCAVKSNLTNIGDGKNYCAVLLSSPCHKMACRIDTTSTSLTINLCTLGSTPAALSGEVIQEYCQFPPFTGCDVAIVGNPARSIDPVTFIGNTACTTNVRASGFVKGQNTCTIGYGGPNGSPATTFNASSFFSGPKDISICQDVEPGNGNDCSGSPTFQLPGGTTPCGCSTAPPGPINVSLSGSVITGDAVSVQALQIHTVSPPAACSGTTSDATFVPLFFTTGATTVELKDPDTGVNPCGDNCGPNLTLSETGGSFSSLQLNNNVNPNSLSVFMDSSDLAGGASSGGFPGACPATLPSLVTAFKIVCGP